MTIDTGSGRIQRGVVVVGGRVVDEVELEELVEELEVLDGLGIEEEEEQARGWRL